MARPKAGTKEGDAASERWRQTMINKYGVDGVHKKMQEIGSKDQGTKEDLLQIKWGKMD